MENAYLCTEKNVEWFDCFCSMIYKIRKMCFRKHRIQKNVTMFS